MDEKNEELVDAQIVEETAACMGTPRASLVARSLTSRRWCWGTKTA